MDQLKYDSLYSGLVSINKSLGGTQSMPDSEYGAMIDLMETLSGQPVGESGDAYNAVSTVATMAENGELPIQNTPELDSVQVDITANGSYEYLPSAYALDGFSKFTANVNVPDSSRLGVKSVNISENGHQEFHAIDFDLDGFSTIGIDVNVPTSGGGEKESISEAGVKFARSTFSTAPNKYRYDSISDASYIFQNCANLESIPDDFNFAGVVDGSYAFHRCTKLTGIPSDIYLTNAVIADEMFGQSGITEVVNFSAPLVEEYADFFKSCPKLTSINGLSIDKATIAYEMFKNCRSLRTIQNFSMPNVTDIGGMFWGCTSLESVPIFDTSNVTATTENVFFNCTSLQHIPSMNLSKVSKLMDPFWGCTNLQSIGEIDLSGLTQAAALFNDNMEFLTDIGGFPGLSIGFTQGFGLDKCPNLSRTSIENVVNNLKDINSTGVIQTLYISGQSVVQGNVDEQIQAAITAKGWSVQYVY